MAVQHILEGPETPPISQVCHDEILEPRHILTIQLVDKSLFISDALVDGEWIKGSETFDVFGMFVETF
jgi:hypothetical protein